MPRWSVPSLAVSLLLSTACDSGSSSAPKSGDEPREDYVCESDGDCRNSCVVETDCCLNPCGCDTVRHVDEHAAVQKAQIAHCADKTEACPDVGACDPTYEYATPKCVAGKCIGEPPAGRE